VFTVQSYILVITQTAGMKRSPFLSSVLLWLLAQVAFAQSFKNDTTFVTAAVNNAVKNYNNAIQGQAQLYNGSDYALYLSLKEEHPYFGTDDWVFGSVYYDGYLYENVPLLYDLASDQLLTETYYSSSVMKLTKNKVRSFTLPDQRLFVNQPDTSLSPGYYEVLYNGKTKAYARHIKILQETLTAQEIIHEFDEKTRYYICMNNQCHAVKSKGALVKLFGDQKREAVQYVKQGRKLQYRKNRREYITRLAEFHDRSQTNP
jgi:hypothetical protein